MYNPNRFNYEGRNINNINYINKYPTIKINRTISPKIGNNSRIGNYYYIEGKQNKNLLYKNININEELLNTQYPNYINPINFPQPQNQNYYNYFSNNNNQSNFYPFQNTQNVFFEQILPPTNEYLYTDINFLPNAIPQHNKKNNLIHNDYVCENNNKYKNDNYKNGVNLNITNCETQYPMTFLSNDSCKQKKTYIQNYNNNINNYIMNSKETENDSISKASKKNSNRNNYNLSKMKNMYDLSGESENISKKTKSKDKYYKRDYNIKNDINKKKSAQLSFNNTTNNFYKKNKHFDFDENIRDEKQYVEDIRNEINIRNKNIKNNNFIKRRIYYENESNKYNYENTNLNNKMTQNNNENIKNKHYAQNKKDVNENKKKYFYIIKKLIEHLEQYYIISFHNFFYYFLDQLKLYNQEKINKNKNSLLKRFQRNTNNKFSDHIKKKYLSKKYIKTNNSNNNYINNNKENYKKITSNRKYINNYRKIYIPKKIRDNMEINRNIINTMSNTNNMSTINYIHYKNRSLDYYTSLTNQNQNDLSYNNNRLDLSIDFIRKSKYQEYLNKENSVDKINCKNIREIYYNINKSYDNLLQNKLTPNSSSFRIINNNFNKKSIIYARPKTNKINIKRMKIAKKNNLNTINESINYNETSNIMNSKYIYNNIINNKKIINDNNNFKTQHNILPIKNIEDFRSSFKIPINENIKIKNENINNSKDNIIKINENIENDDIIEETIIKDICTYDKKFWVFIKYMRSTKTNENYLKFKRIRLSKGVNDELFSLKIIQTDSIELLSQYNRYNCKKVSIKEISEEKESNNNSNIRDENNLNKLSNLINILEDYKKQNFKYLYKYFLNLLRISNNGDNNSLSQNKLYKNVLDNVSRENIYSRNKKQNKLNNRDNKEYWKRNLFPDISKEYTNNYINKEEFDIDLSKIKDLSKKNNSLEEHKNENKIEIEELKKGEKKIIQQINKLKIILMNKYKKHYFILWKNNIDFKKNIINNVSKIFENENSNNLNEILDEKTIIFNFGKKLILFKNYLMKYILKIKKIKESKIEKKKEEEENEEEEEYEYEEEDSL